MARRLRQLSYWQQYSIFQALNRIKRAWLLSQTGASQTYAVHYFQKALKINRHQQAKSLERRVATSLARLYWGADSGLGGLVRHRRRRGGRAVGLGAELIVTSS
jgi:hypothetical protein